MQSKLSRLKAVRILDDDGAVSITSLYLYLGAGLCLYSLNGYSLGFVALALLHVNLKKLSRHMQARESNRITDHMKSESQRLDRLETELRSISTHHQLNKLNAR